MSEPNPHAPASRRGVFISFEGGDGVGKSTQTQRLASYLESRGVEVCHVHEPGGTELGERVRSVLLDSSLGDVDPYAELMLYEAARAQIVTEVIEPALSAGKVVLCDRFADSTVAYQGHGRELDIPTVKRLNDIATRGIEPDRTILLSMDTRAALDRATDGGTEADRMESAGRDFHERVHEGFMALAAANPERVRVIDAAQDPDEVQHAILKALDDLLDGAGKPVERKKK